MKRTAPLAGLAAGILLATGAAAGLALADRGPEPVTRLATPASHDDVSGPCDEAEHATDPRCAGTPTGTAAPPAATEVPPGELRSFAAGPAGVVSYVVEAGGFRLVAATPADGWSVEVERAAGPELDLDFRQGSVRVQVDVGREDGQVRERVRVPDDATGERTRTEALVPAATAPAPAPPVTVDDHGGDVDRDDRIEAGDDRDRSGDDDGVDDDDGDDRDDDDHDDDDDDDGDDRSGRRDGDDPDDD